MLFAEADSESFDGRCNFELGWMLTKYKHIKTFKTENGRK